MIKEQLDHAVKTLQAGGLIAFPTESYYGLGVDIDDCNAIEQLYNVKKRPYSKPILLLIADVDQLSQLVEYIPEEYETIIQRFWPGPLTLIFPAKKGVPSILTGGTGTVGIRISSNNTTRDLCRLWGKPLTGTSANISGMNPATNASEVIFQFGSSVDYIISAERQKKPNCSTIVGTENGGLVVLREGMIPFKEVLEES